MLKQTLRPLLFFVAGLALSAPAWSQSVAQCTPSFSDCAIPENVLLQFPFLAISGDVLVVPNLHADLAATSDVFRIFNNFVDTGAGTGLGFLSFLYSGHNALPNQSTFSANAVEIREQPTGDTQYLGNGTDYHLETAVTPDHGGGKLSAPPRTAVADLADGPVSVAASSGTSVGAGPDQDPGQADGLASYRANYTSLGGKQLAFNIVGTDPSLGAATTTVPTVIVPLKFVFPSAGNLALDGSNAVSATQNSPIFLTADYTVDGTDLGVTQFGDALQRGEFWNLVGFSAGYHVLLGTPSVAPTVTVTLPAGAGNLYKLRNGGSLGVVDTGFFNSLLRALTPSYTASQLPIFLTDNVFLGTGGVISNCCIIGFHNSQSGSISTAKTWIYAGYTESGTFVNNVVSDVQPLSHEVAEWMNDPFVGGSLFTAVNLIPPAILPGTGGACIINFETGDPLEAPPAVFTKTTNATVYHLQDEVFLTWYLHTVPSFSVNHWYTLQNTFPSFSSLCGPG